MGHNKLSHSENQHQGPGTGQREAGERRRRRAASLQLPPTAGARGRGQPLVASTFSAYCGCLGNECLGGKTENNKRKRRRKNSYRIRQRGKSRFLWPSRDPGRAAPGPLE